MIAATPLKSLGWKRDVSMVRIVFRPDTTPETKIQFLDDLIKASIGQQLEALKEIHG